MKNWDDIKSNITSIGKVEIEELEHAAKKKNYWNYRVVKYSVGKEPLTEDWYEVCEVYYEDGVPISFIQDKNPYSQDNMDDLLGVTEKIKRAFEMPMLHWNEKSNKLTCLDDQ
jgi:hypothetical protein